MEFLFELVQFSEFQGEQLVEFTLNYSKVFHSVEITQKLGHR